MILWIVQEDNAGLGRSYRSLQQIGAAMWSSHRTTEATERTEDTEKLSKYQWTQCNHWISGSNERDNRRDDVTRLIPELSLAV